MRKGISLSGLQANSGLGARTTQDMMSQIAAIPLWHANTVRLQVQQQLMVGDGTSFSPDYLAKVTTLVNYALSLSLDVVVNCSTEQSGLPRDIGAPSPATLLFWQHVAPVWAGNSHVTYDLFNEPTCDWVTWQLTFQATVDWVRGLAPNRVWCDGIRWAGTLAGCPGLKGPSISYSFHHPPAPQTPASWDASFGNFSKTHTVVNGEFANYAAGYNWASPVTMLPKYFAYLAARNIGITAWTLADNNLCQPGSYSQPTTEPTGMGELLKAFYAAH